MGKEVWSRENSLHKEGRQCTSLQQQCISLNAMAASTINIVLNRILGESVMYPRRS